jgi:hypothetical protein
MDNQLKINKATLTPEQRDKLEQFQQAETQLQTLEDIAKMTQEIINIVDDNGVDKLGTLLIDIRETLGGLKDKEAPETPDYAKPVVEAVSKLEKALSASIKGIDVKPQVKVDAPAVNVSPPSVDLKGVEKAVSGLSKSFKDAIKDMPTTPETDFAPLLEAWAGISEQLASIDTATRIKPQAPTTIKVTNLDGSAIGNLPDATTYESRNDTTTDTNLVYLGKAIPGTASSAASWQIKRYNKSAGHMSFADDITTFTKVWDDRTSYGY